MDGTLFCSVTQNTEAAASRAECPIRSSLSSPCSTADLDDAMAPGSCCSRRRLWCGGGQRSSASRTELSSTDGEGDRRFGGSMSPLPVRPLEGSVRPVAFRSLERGSAGGDRQCSPSVRRSVDHSGWRMSTVAFERRRRQPRIADVPWSAERSARVWTLPPLMRWTSSGRLRLRSKRGRGGHPAARGR